MLTGMGLALLTLRGPAAHAQPLAQTAVPAPPDSARAVTLPAAVVEARRPAYFAAGARFTRLDSAALLPTGSLADALALGSALYLRQNGPGQLASLSIRGTSARHVAVLWHGFNLSFPTLGEADFALLPTAGFSGVEIHHGPAAARYGSGAMGGAVVLTTEPTWGAGPHAAAQFTGGSFGQRAVRAEGGVSTDLVRVQTTFLDRRADNDFPFRPSERPGTPLVRQPNAAQHQQSLSHEVAVRLSPRDELTAAAWLTRADRQIQPLLSATNDHAREQDESQRLTLAYTRQHRQAATTARVAYLADRIRYGSDRVSLSDSRMRSTQVQLEHVRSLTDHLSLELGAEGQRFRALVTDYGHPITEYRLAAFALLRYAPSPRLRISANARQAALPGRRPPLTPTLGAEWQALGGTRGRLWLKASAARSYRAPTLNERYWQPGGNPALLPETGLGYEAGLRYAYAAGPLTAEAELTAYRLRVDDWVQWTPTADGGAWSPRNLRRVLSRGVEATGRVGWQRGRYHGTGRLGYTLTQARKVSGYALDADPIGPQLAYVPLHAVSLGTDHTWRDWQLSAGGSYTSFRYVTASATDFLPGYWLAQASLGRTFRAGPVRLTTLLQGFNLTNTRYQSLAARAMPGRSVAATLRVAWH